VRTRKARFRELLHLALKITLPLLPPNPCQADALR
jgi:hypothetical protein